MAQRALGRQAGLGGVVPLGGVLAPALVPVLTSAQCEVVTPPGVIAHPALGGVFGTAALDDHEAAESLSILAACFPFILPAIVVLLVKLCVCVAVSDLDLLRDLGVVLVDVV